MVVMLWWLRQILLGSQIVCTALGRLVHCRVHIAMQQQRMVRVIGRLVWQMVRETVGLLSTTASWSWEMAGVAGGAGKQTVAKVDHTDMGIVDSSK